MQWFPSDNQPPNHNEKKYKRRINKQKYLEKCSFGMQWNQYLEYIMDEKGVHVDPTKIQVIHNCPTPKIMTELCSFLGLSKFYQ